jgi:hypothetical protein
MRAYLYRSTIYNRGNEAWLETSKVHHAGARGCMVIPTDLKNTDYKPWAYILS